MMEAVKVDVETPETTSLKTEKTENVEKTETVS